MDLLDSDSEAMEESNISRSVKKEEFDVNI